MAKKDTNIKRIIVVYAGRFQPFHKGHYAGYKLLVSIFGADSVFIGTSDVTNSFNSPFSFKEKREMMSKLFGVPTNRVVNVKNPYAPKEVLSKFDPKTTAFVTAVGEKDAQRLGGKYFRIWNGAADAGYDTHGYVFILPSQEGNISGTMVRQLLSGDEQTVRREFLKLYPKFDEKVFKNIVTKIKALKEQMDFMKGYPSKDDVENIIRRNNDLDELVNDVDIFLEDYFNEAESDPKYDEEITYTDSTGQKRNITVRGALHLPKEHPARVEADKMVQRIPQALTQKQTSSIPPVPGQPVHKNTTVQGQIDKLKQKSIKNVTPQERERLPQKINASEFKTDAEKKEKQMNEQQHNFKTFRDLFNKAPSSLQKLVYDLKNFPQNLTYHPEGNVLKHTISVVNRALKYAPGDIELAIAALMHDLGKASTMGISPRTGKPNFHGHAIASAEIVKKYSAWIKSMGGEPKDVLYIVQHHMDMKDMDVDKLAKSRNIVGHPKYSKLQSFSSKMDKGGLHIDRLNDPRNGNEITEDELLQFFKKLSNNKMQFIDFLNKFREIVVKDSKSNLNIPFAKMANKVIAKTVMRKPNFSTSNPVLVNENRTKQLVRTIAEFIKFAQECLELKCRPNVKLIQDQSFTKNLRTFGGYDPDTDEILVYIRNRNAADILRTLAHELAHLKQKQSGYATNVEDGDTGSDVENEANAVAGILLREFGKYNSKIYESVVKESTGLDFLERERVKLIRRALKEFPNSPKQLKIRAEIDKLNKLIAKTRDTLKEWSDAIYELENDRNRLILKAMQYAPDSPMQIKLKAEIERISQKIAQIYRQSVLESNELLNEATSSEIIKDLDKVKSDLLKRADVLIAKKQKLYSNVDIESPMTADEKKLDKDIADIFSQINQIVLQKRNLKKETVNELINDTQNSTNPLDTRTLLLCGGAYGHMAHPFDADINLTFGDLRNIIDNALSGELGVVKEKVDGQALAISWRNGKLIAARNKGHLMNSGESALDISGMESKFRGRGELSDAYLYAMNDLNAAINALSQTDKEKLFKNGKAFCNLEVVYPASSNVIPYGQSLLIFHNIVEYDEKGNAIGTVKGGENKLASLIKRVNANVQSKYTLQGPPITKIPKNEKLSSHRGKFNAMLSKLQSEFNLPDNAGVGDYHFSWWMAFIDKANKKLTPAEREGLAKRWAFNNKSFTIKSVSDVDARHWAEKIDKEAKDRIVKSNLKKFEDIFLGVGAEVLSFMSSVLTVSPDTATRSMKSALDSAIKQIRSDGTAAQVKKLERELARLEAIGGFDKIVPNEGIVFEYPAGSGKVFKLTGSFAALNQLMGIMKFK